MSGPHPSEGSASSPSSPSSSQNNTYFNYQAAINNNAPKYGTLVPNRVFVGGIGSNTSEDELCQLFSQYGNVTETKIVMDRAGVSKGYGFITFDTEEEAKRLQKDSDNIIYKEKRLNIAPAIKKQVYPGTYDSLPTVTSPVPAAPTPHMYYHNGMPITYHNGTAFFPSNGQQMVPPTPPTTSTTQETSVYPQPTYAPPAAPQSNQAAYGAPVMYANPAPMFVPTQPYQYSPMAFESFYQVAPNTSYIYASPGPPLVGPPNSGTDAIQYQIYPPQPPSDMFYTTAPMYPTTMLLNYDPASYYPYSVDSTASSTTGLELSSNSNYSEDDPNSNPPSVPAVTPQETEQSRPTETPVVSLLKLQETPHEEREITSSRRNTTGPRKATPATAHNTNTPGHGPPSHQLQHSSPDSPTLVYYPNNMYGTPGNVNNAKYVPMNYHQHHPSQLPPHIQHHPRPNLNRGANLTFRHKTPPNSNYIAKTQQFPKFSRPNTMYYNNNNNNNNSIYDHNKSKHHAMVDNNKHAASMDSRDTNNTRDSPKRSVSPPPPPYSPMIQPLFINSEVPYSSFSPPAQMMQSPHMPQQPRSYQVQSNGAPRRMNPRNPGKTSTVS